jgi:hypothetical protein
MYAMNFSAGEKVYSLAPRLETGAIRKPAISSEKTNAAAEAAAKTTRIAITRFLSSSRCSSHSSDALAASSL